jgi:RNA polymerase sigma-70 factor (ECF subfamily)
MPEADFNDVLTRAHEGDEAAFVAIFRSVQPLLLRYLRTVARDLADDVAAETWVSVVRGLDTFKGDEAGFRAWVFTIARARLVDAHRTARRHGTPTDTRDLLGGEADGVDVAGAVEELMTTEAALALIGRLPPNQAEVVLLRHMVGLDVAQTAQVLRKRPGAVRVAAHRGLQRLKAVIDELEQPDPETPSNADTARSG